MNPSTEKKLDKLYDMIRPLFEDYGWITKEKFEANTGRTYNKYALNKLAKDFPGCVKRKGHSVLIHYANWIQAHKEVQPRKAS